MVERSPWFTSDKFYSALRLPRCFHTKISPHHVERNALRWAEILSVLLRRKREKTGGQNFWKQNLCKGKCFHSTKKTPYRAVLEFSPMCDVLHAACTYSAVLGLQVKGKCNHIGGVLFAFEDFTRRRFQNNPKPLTSTPRLSVWVIPRNQRVAAKPIDKVLIRKIPVFQ